MNEEVVNYCRAYTENGKPEYLCDAFINLDPQMRKCEFFASGRVSGKFISLERCKFSKCANCGYICENSEAHFDKKLEQI